MVVAFVHTLDIFYNGMIDQSVHILYCDDAFFVLSMEI